MALTMRAGGNLTSLGRPTAVNAGHGGLQNLMNIRADNALRADGLDTLLSRQTDGSYLLAEKQGTDGAITNFIDANYTLDPSGQLVRDDSTMRERQQYNPSAWVNFRDGVVTAAPYIAAVAGAGALSASMGAGAAGSAAGSAAGTTAGTTAGSGLTAGTGGSGLAMGGGSIGGTGLTAGGTAATGLTAAPGAGLTLAAPTGTGAGLAAGTGAGTIGAGIGASLPAVGSSVISPSIAAQAAANSAGRVPSAAASAPSMASRLAEQLGMSPQAMRLLMGGLGALAGASQGTGSSAPATPAGPPVQWQTGLTMARQPTQRRATPQAAAVPASGGNGAGRFIRRGLTMG